MNRMPNRKAIVVSPYGAGSASGNWETAKRYAALLQSAGVDASAVCLDEVLHGLSSENLQKDASLRWVLLHARRSHPLATQLASLGLRYTVVLTGTDVYGDLAQPDSSGEFTAMALSTIESAQAVLALQSDAAAQLHHHLKRFGRTLHGRLAVIEQTANVLADPTANSRSDHAQSPDDVYRVLMVGNVRSEKDPLTALGALEDWAMERSRQDRRRMQLVHCGASLDDSLYAAMRAYARALPEVFTFRGAVSKSEVFEEMHNANVLLHPSVAEGGSLVIAEAVACDLPVLASDIGCHRAMLGSDYPGLFGVGDRASLTDILTNAWSAWGLDSSDSVESVPARCRRAYPGIRERLCDSSRERDQLIGLLWPEGDAR